MARIIIVGGGAGGLELATKLGRKFRRDQETTVTLVDRKASHLWKPLLHEVATGSLDAGVDALSYRAHAKNHGFDFQMGSLCDIDRERKVIILDELKDAGGELLIPARELEYDYLVMAIGSTSNDFNTPGVRDNCIFLDSPEQAHRFREEMNNQFLNFTQTQAKALWILLSLVQVLLVLSFLLSFTTQSKNCVTTALAT